MTITPLVFQLNPWVDRDGVAPSTRRFLDWYDNTLILFLGCRCNLRCLYCFAPKDLAPAYPLPELEAALDQAARAGLRRVILTGGEPLLHPDLDALLPLLKTYGFDSFGVQTNGMRLRDPARVEHLVAAGLRFCHVSFDSPDPATQDRLAGGRARVHEGVQTALGNLSRFPEVTLSVKAVITSLNQHQLPAYVAHLARLRETLGIAPMLTLTPMLPPTPRYDPLLVRYRRIAPLVRDAIAAGQAAGILTWYHHLPYCCVEGNAEASADYHTQDGFLEPDGRTTTGNLYRKGDRCAECSLEAVCQGFSRNYALLFSEAEFSPVGQPQAPPPGPRRRARPRRPPVASGGTRVVLGAFRDGAVEYLHWDRAVSVSRGLRGRKGDRVILTGPEPLLHPTLPEILGAYGGGDHEVWLETLGLGLQRDAPLRALIQLGLAGVRWLHAPEGAAPYRTYLREVPLATFVQRTAAVLSRARIPVEHVILRGGEPLAETVARVARLQTLAEATAPLSRWVTSAVVPAEAWSAWLGLEVSPPGAASSAQLDQLDQLPPLESSDGFRTQLDAVSPHDAGEARTSPVGNGPPEARRATASFDPTFPFCTVECWDHPDGVRYELLLRVTTRCNQRCAFCSGPLPAPDPPLAALTACLERAATELPGAEVMLTGGEPLLRDDLSSLVDQALRLPGFRRVYLQTNAVLAARAEALPISERLAFFVSLHGVTDEVYDRCTGTTGQLGDALAGIHRLQDLGHPVILNCVVNRHNVEHLDAVVEAAAGLAARGPLKSVHFSILMCPDHRPAAADLLVPYHLAAPRLVHAWELAQSLGVPVEPLVSSTHAAIPACLVAPAHRRPPGIRPAHAPQESGLAGEGRPWVKAPGCRDCPEDGACLGVPRPYFLRFGLGELRPIPRG